MSWMSDERNASSASHRLCRCAISRAAAPAQIERRQKLSKSKPISSSPEPPIDFASVNPSVSAFSE